MARFNVYIFIPAMFVAFPGTPLWASDDLTPKANPPVICRSDLEGEIDYPRGWGLDPGELNSLLESKPELRDHVRSLVALAHFLDEDSADFLRFFAAGMNFGFTREIVESSTTEGSPDEFEHRLQVTSMRLAEAADKGLIPVQLTDSRSAFLISRILGPLPFAKPVLISPTRLAKMADLQSIDRLVPRDGIVFRDLVLQSREAQLIVFALSPAFEDYLNFGRLYELHDAFLQRLVGGPKTGKGRVDLIIDDAFRFIDGEHPGDLAVEKRLREAGRGRRQILVSRHDSLRLALALTAIAAQVRRGLLNVFDKSNAISAPTHDPYSVFSTLRLLVGSDLVIDRGLQPYLLRMLSQLVIGQSSPTRLALNQSLREGLKRYISELRVLMAEKRIEARAPTHRLAKSAASINLSQKPKFATPTRAERIRNYVRESSLSDRRKTPPANALLTVTDRVDKTPTIFIENGIWDRLCNPELPLSEAKRLFLQNLKPDETFILPLLRDGFRYRVNLSQRLIEQLLNPAVNEPADLRLWLEAMRFGRARDDGQRGWKKLSVPIDKIYEWEIKLHTSPYRILGYKLPDGVWRFDTIRLMH